jgi:hypothetical protein
LSVRIVESTAQIPRPLWDACFPPPLEGQWWYQTLETCGLDDQFRFRYGVIYEATRAVGIAPIFMMDVPLSIVAPPVLRSLLRFLEKQLPSLFRQRTLFVGSPCADEGTVGVLPGVDRRDALLCIQHSIEIEARKFACTLIVWKDFPASFTDEMNWLADKHGLFRLTSFPNTIVEFPTVRKEDYFASLKSSRRNKLKKKLRRSSQQIDLHFEVIQSPDDATITELYDLFMQTYTRSKTRFEKLNRRFFEIVATQPMAHFLVLREKQSREMIAFMLCFDLGERIINKFIGMNYHCPRDWFVYFRLWDAAVDWALSRGASSLQSGQTAYEAKIEIGHKLIPLTIYGKHRNRFLHAIMRPIADRIGWDTLDDNLAKLLKAHPELKSLQWGATERK